MVALKNTSPTTMVGRLSPDKEKHLLDVARELILAQGLSAVTVDKIAKAGGLSKATIYRRFDNKMMIFEQLAIKMIESFVGGIDAIDMDVGQAERVLFDVAECIRQSMARPEHINLLRELIAEIPRNEHLNQWVKTDINPIIPHRLIDFFERLITCGKMTHADPIHAASTFMTLCSDGYYILMDTQGSDAAIKIRLHADVAMFMRGCGITLV